MICGVVHDSGQIMMMEYHYGHYKFFPKKFHEGSIVPDPSPTITNIHTIHTSAKSRKRTSATPTPNLLPHSTAIKAPHFTYQAEIHPHQHTT
eukprot:5144694-Ditylum_brightwellii.AAC.1